MPIKKTHLLLIDPQVDFCDPSGSLFVTGADEDMKRVGEMITRMGEKISSIHTTLDQHHIMDIAHPVFWKNTEGKRPDPFTIITAQDVKNGVWIPHYPSMTQKMIEYTEALEKGGRYPLCIWPVHCAIGSPGAAMVPCIAEPIKEWIGKVFRTVNFVAKGSNPMTEHYSGVKAEVEDPTDPSTSLNVSLINTLENADEILLAGEAGSHCLANTVKDIADNFGNTNYIEKFVFLEDGTSPVTGFEQLQEDFIKEISAKGMRIAKTTDF